MKKLPTACITVENRKDSMPLSGDLYHFLHQGGRSGQPPVILLHGLAADCLFWPPEIRRLPGQNVLALDLPGHGKSGGLSCQSVEDYAHAVLAWMDRLGIWSAVFVGHSLGAAIALALAHQEPQRVLGLGLVSAGIRLNIPLALIEDASSPAMRPTAVQRLSSLICSAQTPPSLQERVCQKLATTRPNLLYNDLIACHVFSAEAHLTALHPPALVVIGTEDKLIPPWQASRLAASLPQATLQTVDRAGHLLPLEQPKRLADLLSDFLGRIVPQL